MKSFAAAMVAVLGVASIAELAPPSSDTNSLQVPSGHVSFGAMGKAVPTTTPLTTTKAPATTVDPDSPSTTAAVVTARPTPSATSTTTPAPTTKPNGVTPPSSARPSSTSPSTTSTAVAASVQCPFVFTSALVTTEFNAVLDEILANNAAKNSTNATDIIVSPPTTTTSRVTTSTPQTTVRPPSPITTASSSSRVMQSNTRTTSAVPTTSAPGDETTPAPTTGTGKPVSTPRATTTTPTTTALRPVTTTAAPPSISPISDGKRRRLAENTTVAFACDASFYGKWITSGLTCGGADLDVDAAVQNAACATYRGDVLLPAVTVASCLTTCAFPSCVNSTWVYKPSPKLPGFGSAVYANFDFSQWFTASMNDQLKARTQDIVNFHNFSMTVIDTCPSPAGCKCPVYVPPTDKSTNPKDDLNNRIQEAKKQQLRAADFAPQTDWVPRTPLESVASFTASVTQYATYIGVATSASAVAVTSLVSTSAVVTSSGAASAAAAGSAASLSVAISLLDMASFVTSVSQLNVERLPPPMGNVAASVSTFQFSFFVWESAKYVAPTPVAKGGRSLAIAADNTMSGMERYAATVGIRPDQLFYVTLMGICIAAGVIGVALAVVLAGGLAFSKDFKSYRSQMTDRGVGACMLLAVVAQYAIGVTGTFEITRAVDSGHAWGVSVFVAVAALLVLSVGTIVYGYLVVRQHEHDIRDIGTKDHFEKPVHRRYGCLYDEYNFANRFFFVVKMLLALFVGMTTGMSKLSGLAQVLVLVGLHVIFVLYLEVRQPHLAKFVQAATTLITVMKIAALGLTAFLLSAVVELPPTARNVVGYVILSLQGLVVLFLVVRQVFIFYRQWKLKQLPDQERISVTDFYGGNATSTDAMAKLDEDDDNQRTCVDHGSVRSSASGGSARRLPPLNHPGKEYTF